jgi:chemotaxis protein histidine kinase CheA
LNIDFLPTATNMEDYRRLLTNLYKKYDPKKVSQVDFYLNKYKGKEKQFYLAQKARYIAKKTNKDSEKILSEAIAKIKKDRPKSETIEEPKTEEKPDKTAMENKAAQAKKNEKAEEKEKKATTVETAPKSKSSKEMEPPEGPKKEKPLIIHSTEKKPNDIEPETNKTEDTAKKVSEEKQDEDKNKKRGAVWYIWGLVLLLLIVFVIYFLCFRSDSATTKNENRDEKTDQVKEKDNAETTVPVQIIEEKEPAPKDEGTKREPSSYRIYAADIDGTVFFIACSALKKEDQAKTEVKRLKTFELDAHYYWIPDLLPNGNPFFKVVIGPFDNAKEAMPKLTKIQERINFDAYLLEIKEPNSAQ